MTYSEILEKIDQEVNKAIIDLGDFNKKEIKEKVEKFLKKDKYTEVIALLILLLLELK